jgi:hypothetical protein
MVSDEDTVDEIVDAFMNSANPRIRKFIRSMVRAELRGVDPSWVDQHMSVLGNKRHIAAVRRRLNADPQEPGARWDGYRKYLLSQEAIAEELGRLSALSAPGVRKTRAENDLDEEGAEVLAQLDRDLARVGR